MKISKRIITIGAEALEVEIHYDRKNSVFSIVGLPIDFASMSETWTNTKGVAPSENELWSNFLKSKDEYLHMKESSKLVILLSVSVPIRIIGESLNNSSGFSIDQKYHRKVGSIGSHSNSENSMKLSFDIATEIDKNGAKEYILHKLSDTLEDNGPSNVIRHVKGSLTPPQVLDYSRATHDFLKHSIFAMDKIASSLANFAAQDNIEQFVLEQGDLKLLS